MTINLNDKQLEAVEKLDGYVLILAGAGTGKTRVLTSRIIKILEKDLTTSKHILAVTFTNKAANEMKSRIYQDGVILNWLGTFHSLCLKILRLNADKFGYNSNFSVIDSEDQLRLITQLFKNRKIDNKVLLPKTIMYYIRKWKDKGMFPENLTTKMEHIEIIRIYKEYQDRLEALKSMDFSDLIAKCIKLFELYPTVLSYYQDLFSYILVDEYQDTNAAQYTWLKMLSLKHKNLCCVGDDDQSIYGWRGAEVGNILKFEHEFENVKIIRLEQNYRSKGHILKTASGLISKNEKRLSKELWTESGMGEKVLVQETKNEADEAKYVSDKIVEFKKNHDLNEIAILVRAGFQTRVFEEKLLTLGISYKIIGGLKFYERKEIKDVLAYSKLLLFPYDELAFERVVNTPKRGVGPIAIQTFHKIALEQGISFVRAAELYSSIKPSSKLQTFFIQMEKFRGMLQNEIDVKENHQNIIEKMLDETGYIEFISKENTIESQGRLENIREFIKAIGDFGSLQTFLEHVHMLSENSLDEKSAINMMTVHASKGLEFNVVFLAGWEDGLFPSAKAIQEKGLEGEEEERRLAYVGLSRSKERAIITYKRQRRQGKIYLQATPSRFISELPKDHIIHNKLSIVENKSNTFEVGDLVNHKYFGEGTVLGVDGNKTIVDFDSVGEKHIFSEFLNTCM